MSKESLSISDKAYLSAKSIRDIGGSLYYLLIMFWAFSWFIFLYAILVKPAIFLELSEKAWIFLLPMSAMVLLSPIIAWELYKGWRSYRLFTEWHYDFLCQQYILNFEITIPRGINTAEKILSISRLVFPELRGGHRSYASRIIDGIAQFLKIKKTISEDEIISRSLNYSVDSYNFDLALKTKAGYFVVKDFGEKVVIFEDLKNLVSTMDRGFKGRVLTVKIFRVICVAKDYEESFFNREWLRKKNE